MSDTATQVVKSGVMTATQKVITAVVVFIFVLGGGIGFWLTFGDRVTAEINFRQNVSDNSEIIAQKILPFIDAYNAGVVERETEKLQAAAKLTSIDGIQATATSNADKLLVVEAAVRDLVTRVDDLAAAATRLTEAVSSNTRSKDDQVLRATKRISEHAQRDLRLDYHAEYLHSLTDAVNAIRDVLIAEGADLEALEIPVYSKGG